MLLTKLHFRVTPDHLARPSKRGYRKITRPIRAYSSHERRNHQSESDDSGVIQKSCVCVCVAVVMCICTSVYDCTLRESICVSSLLCVSVSAQVYYRSAPQPLTGNESFMCFHYFVPDNRITLRAVGRDRGWRNAVKSD